MVQFWHKLLLVFAGLLVFILGAYIAVTNTAQFSSPPVTYPGNQLAGLILIITGLFIIGSGWAIRHHG